MSLKDMKEGFKKRGASMTRPGKGFRPGYWKSQVQIPKVTEDSRGIPVLVMPYLFADPTSNNAELPGVVYDEHMFRIGTDFLGSDLCTAGLLQKKSPCNYCHAESSERYPNVSLFPTRKVGLPVFVLRDFHEVPVTDDKDNVKVNPTTKKPYTFSRICTDKPDTCPDCRANHSKTFGRLQFLSLGNKHWEEFRGFHETISTMCACGSFIRENGSCEGCKKPIPLTVFPVSEAIPVVLYLSKTAKIDGGDRSNNKNFVAPSITKTLHRPVTDFMVNDEPLATLDMESATQAEPYPLWWSCGIADLINDPPVDFVPLLHPEKQEDKMAAFLKGQANNIREKLKVHNFESPFTQEMADYEEYSKEAKVKREAKTE